MFGKRGNESAGRSAAEARAAVAAEAPKPAQAAPAAAAQVSGQISASSEKQAKPARERNESYYDTKSQVFSALIDTIDLSQLAKLDADSAREEIRDIVNDIIAIKNFAMTISRAW